jgi:hypothetical protein
VQVAGKIRRQTPNAVSAATTTTPMVTSDNGGDKIVIGIENGGMGTSPYQGHIKEYTVLLCNAAILLVLYSTRFPTEICTRRCHWFPRLLA